MKTHINKKPYQCIQCLKTFSDDSDLITHMSTQCRQADKDFSSLTTILDNQSQPIYECSQHDKGFSDNCDLTGFLNKGTEEKTYQCKHTGKKPYQCRQCEKDISNLTTILDKGSHSEIINFKGIE